MKTELMKYLESEVEKYGGEYGLNHSRRLLKLVDMLAGEKDYHNDVVTFCAYVHDFGAYNEFAVKGMDHAVRSDEISEQFMGRFNFTEEEKTIIHSIILSHHKPGDLPLYEATLFRDADAIDFAGVIGIARDFARAPRDLKKAVQSIEEHQKLLLQSVTLDKAKEVLAKRVDEMKEFLDLFYQESFHLF